MLLNCVTISTCIGLLAIGSYYSALMETDMFYLSQYVRDIDHVIQWHYF